MLKQTFQAMIGTYHSAVGCDLRLRREFLGGCVGQELKTADSLSASASPPLHSIAHNSVSRRSSSHTNRRVDSYGNRKYRGISKDDV